MHTSGSILYTILERIRGYLDTPDDKYSDSYILNHVVMPEYVNVWSRLALSMENPIVLRHTFTTAEGQQSYQMPPNVQEVWGIYRYDGTTDRKTAQYEPTGGAWAPGGPGWRIEGNTIFFRPVPTSGTRWDLLYMPSGDFLMHYGTGTVSSTTEVVLASSPTLGQLDRRLNGYGGGILRVIKKSDDSVLTVEERIVRSYAPDTRTVTVDPALSSYSDTDEVLYEVVPVGTQNLSSAVAAAGAMNLGAAMNVSQKQMEFFRRQYLGHRKTIMDNLANINQKRPKHFDRNTEDNPQSYLWFMS